MAQLVNIHTNLKAFQAKVSAAAYKQIPYATSQALTALAKDVQKAEQENEAKVLDRPKPFTQSAVKVIPARKGSNTAKVVMQDLTARYLAPYEFGGSNVLNGRALLKPIGAMKDLDQFGNLPRRLVAKLKARGDIFVGKIKTKRGMVDGVWQRSSEEGGSVPVTRSGKGGAPRIGKTKKGLNTSGRLQLLIKFTDAHAVKQRLGWFKVAESTVNRNFNKRMGAALAKAIATAKS